MRENSIIARLRKLEPFRIYRDLKERVALKESVGAGYRAVINLDEPVVLGRASMTVVQRRPTRWLSEGVPDPESYVQVGEAETVWNQITNSGRDFLHQQGYQGTGAGQGSYTAGNGLNYIALTNTAITPAAGDTTLSGEIVANGLARTQGTVTHSAGTNTTTIANTFTCVTLAQAAQAAALFSASSSGTMNHELTFTQRSLQIADQLSVTYTITLG
jgi:hypothetical protein